MYEIEVPSHIGDARVVCYAVVNLAMPIGGTQHFVNGVQSGNAYGLAVCQYDNDSAYYLFYCNDHWVEFADTRHETIDDAKDQAEFEYAGISGNWMIK